MPTYDKLAHSDRRRLGLREAEARGLTVPDPPAP